MTSNPNDSIESILQDFRIEYIADFRWKKDRINHPDAEDFLRRRLTSLLESKAAEIEALVNDHEKTYGCRRCEAFKEAAAIIRRSI